MDYKKWIAIGLGGVLGLSHFGMIGIIANRKTDSKFPQFNIPVSDYTSYSLQATEEGYAINYRANDPLVMQTTKTIPGKAGSGLTSVPFVGWVLAGAASMIGMNEGAELGGDIAEQFADACVEEDIN